MFINTGDTRNPLRGSSWRLFKDSVINDTRLEPGFDDLSHCRVGVEFFEKFLMVDVIERTFDIGIQDILGLVSDGDKDSGDGIMTGTPRAKSVAVWLEIAFPFWLKRKFDEGLVRSCFHNGNTKRTLFHLPWLRNVNSSHRLGFLLFP